MTWSHLQAFPLHTRVPSDRYADEGEPWWDSMEDNEATFILFWPIAFYFNARTLHPFGLAFFRAVQWEIRASIAAGSPI